MDKLIINKLVDSQEAASCGRAKNTNEAINVSAPFPLMASTRPPRAPSSLQAWQKPYFMSQLGGAPGASGSGTSRLTSGCFFQPPPPPTPSSSPPPHNPLSMKVDQTNNQMTPNLSSISPSLVATTAGDNSTKIDVGDAIHEIRWGRKLDLSMDPKKLKRVISNRLSSQRSRSKKLQHISDMEKQVQDLETQIAALSPQVTFYRNQKAILEMEQKELKARIDACGNRKILIDAEIEANKAEVIRLRELQITQQIKKMEEQAKMAAWESSGFSQAQMENPGLNHHQLRAGQGLFFIDPDQAEVGDNIAEINTLNQLSLKQQENPRGQIPIGMSGWETGHGPLPNLGLNQSAGPPPSSSLPRHRRSLSVIPDFGGIEQILNINTGNPNP